MNAFDIVMSLASTSPWFKSDKTVYTCPLCGAEVDGKIEQRVLGSDVGVIACAMRALHDPKRHAESCPWRQAVLYVKAWQAGELPDVAEPALEEVRRLKFQSAEEVLHWADRYRHVGAEVLGRILLRPYEFY